EIEPDVVLPSSADHSLNQWFEANGSSLKMLKEAFQQINAESAKASKPQDTETIKEIIRGGVGFDRVNKAVTDKLRKQLVGVMTKIVTEYLEKEDVRDDVESPQ
ncbi:unnamed protein product, partial [Symbiodinium pilosum]